MDSDGRSNASAEPLPRRLSYDGSMRSMGVTLLVLGACTGTQADPPDDMGPTQGLPLTTTTLSGDTTGSTTDPAIGSSTGSTGMDPEGSETAADTTGTTGAEPSYAVELSLVTEDNRAHPEMYGGWGPHLRGIMRDPTGVLWFTSDAGPNVLTNASIRYYRRDDAGWVLFSQQPHLPGVQQNSASLLSGSSIRTYSVNVASNTLEECYQDRVDPAIHACNTITIGGAYSTPPNSNYVGAALAPNGARVVWFATVGGAGSGQLTYTYDFGGGWNGPVALTLPGYNTLEYMRASFGEPNTITWHGQLLLGRYPGGTFDPGIAQAMLGQLPSLQVLGGDGPGVDVISGADVWVDPVSGDQHAIAQAQPRMAYYFRPGGEDWSGHAEPVHWFEDTFRARFSVPATGGFALIRGSSSGASGVDVWIAERTRGLPIDWNAAAVVPVPTEVPGLERPSGIYVEADTYQTEPVGGFEFALCGAFGESDHQIWHGSVTLR